MKKIIVLLSLVFTINPLFSGSGQAGMAFLSLPSSASSGAVMNVFTSSRQTPATIFNSPLGIGSDKARISFSHNMWFSDVSSEVLALSFPTKYGNVGVGGNFVRIPGIEVRFKPTDQPEQEIEGQYFSGNLTYNKEIIKSVKIGGTLKYLYEYGYNESAHGIAADMGIIWNSPADLNISLLLKNVGEMQNLYQNATKLPTIIQIGAMRPEILNEGPLSLAIGCNLKMNTQSEENGAQFGTEASLFEIFNLRAGYEQFGDVSKKAFGAGINYNKITIDYALLIMDNGLGNPKLLSVGYQF